MRHFIFMFLLIILPLHGTLSAATEYQHTFASSEDGNGDSPGSTSVSGDGGIALAADIDLDRDGDFFDALFFGVASLPTVMPLRHCAARVEHSVPLQQAVIFSKRPDRPQWPLAV